MNNKDLFNAINDIDEKFIEDAGKYLNDDEADDPLRSRDIEIYPGETRFSPLKLIASIAAAAVFITGVTIAVNHYRGRLSIAPNAASDNAPISEAVEPASNPDNLGTHAITTEVGPLPFELIGPDGKQICYEDIAAVDNIVDAGISEDGWETISLNFAYFALPSGSNYNSIDDHEIDFATAGDVMMTRSFRRIYKGGTYIDLTAKNAYSVLKRETITDPDTGEQTKFTYLSENYIEFEGETTAEVYIYNDSGSYCCIFRNGADHFPIVGYDVPNYLKNNEYSSKLSTLQNKNGFGYAGDMPVMWLDEEEEKFVESPLNNANYLRATATFSNVTLKGTQDYLKTGYDINADITKIDISFVDTLVTDNNLYDVTPFTGETEKQLRSILGSASDIAELKNNGEVKSLTGCDEIRVYKGSELNGTFGEELYDGKLESGDRSNSNVIVLYTDGNPIAAYDYFKYNLVRKSE